MKIEFAKGLSLPDDAATQTFAFIARKGAGKSYAAGKLVEGLHARRDQFVVLSPLPNWYGLRLAADGKSTGLDVVILGGLRGDIPLDASSGALVANAVLDSGRSFVLDVSQFSLGERKRFTAAFGEQLWQRQKALEDPQPIHVVLEEAQLFLPQAIYKGDEHMVGIWNEIVRLGRNCGIGVSLITQRPQSVTKEALTQVECLVVLQVNGVPEKKALREWIVEKGADTNLLEKLPFLEQGVAYIWSPQWLQHFGKHEILPKWTFDSGATPKGGKARVKAELKPLDLDKLKLQMAETVKRLEANDPAALRKRVRELELEVSKKGGGASVGELSRLQAEHKRSFDEFRSKAIALVQDASMEGARAQAVMLSMLKSLQPIPVPTPEQRVEQASLAHRVRLRSTSPTVVRERLPPEQPNGEQLNKGVRSMMRALASRHPAGLTKNQLATLAGLSPSSGTFSTYLSKLRTLGYLYETPDGVIDIIPSAISVLGEQVSQPLSTAELVAQWKDKFPSKVGEMLDQLVSRFPAQMTKGELGQLVGISPVSGTFSTYLSKLRSNGLVVVDRQHGQLKASEDLFL